MDVVLASLGNFFRVMIKGKPASTWSKSLEKEEPASHRGFSSQLTVKKEMLTAGRLKGPQWDSVQFVQELWEGRCLF